MKVIKKTKEYTVYQKGSGRFAVKNADKNWVNGDEKIAILLAQGLIKTAAPAPAPAPEPVVEEVAVEEVAPDVEEAPVAEVVEEPAAEVVEEAAPEVVEEPAAEVV